MIFQHNTKSLKASAKASEVSTSWKETQLTIAEHSNVVFSNSYCLWLKDKSYNVPPAQQQQ
jgi:hypothetical protein